MKKIVSLVVVISIYAVLPVSAFAAEGEGSGWGWIETIGRWANLFILIGAIYYFTRESIKKFFVSRRQGIADEIEAAQDARADAESKLEEMERRVGALDEELEELRRQAEEEAQEERRRALELGEKEVEKVIQTAEREIGGLAKAARLDLKAYAAELAVEMARSKIEAELDQDTKEHVVERFIVKLNTADEEQS